MANPFREAMGGAQAPRAGRRNLAPSLLPLSSKLIELKMAAIKAERPYSEATERLNDMCSRAYQLLVKTLDEECESAAP